MARDFIDVTDRFLGLHQCEVGEGRLKNGESPMMKNLSVTSNFTLIQRDGWEEVSATKGVGRGIWSGDFGTVWIVGDSVWLKSSQEEKVIGKLETDSGEVCIFPFCSRLYFLDGKRIKVWDGTAFGDIEPYVPLIAVSCDYLGAGSSFEAVNLLTGTRRQSFTPDGEHSDFQLAEKELTSVDSVKIFGETLSRGKYVVDLEKGKVKFDDAPTQTYPNCIEITYTKSGNDSDAVHRMKYALAYGGDNDTRVFLWGDGENPSYVRYSGVYNGTSGMEYFPALNFNRIGSGGKLTSVIRHYDSLMLFCENETFVCSSEVHVNENGGEYTVYPIKTVSSETGCGAEGFARLIDNTPVTLTASGLYRWQSSTIRDERNSKEIGERIREGLKELGVEGVHSFDKAASSELYVWRGDKVYVYNYALDVFYYYEGFDAAAFTEDSGGVTWFVRSSGELCRFTQDKSDGGAPIPFRWESGYEEHYGLDKKNVHRLEFELYPIIATGFRFIWVSERETGRYDTLEVEYSLADFSHMRFDAFSFNTANTPVRLHKRIKAKRVGGFKLIIENDGSKGDFHLLSIGVMGRLIDTQ